MSIDQILQQAKELPRILAEIDDSAFNTEARMREDLHNDLLAMRLGRAFLQGRFDRFIQRDETAALGMRPPYETREECDLYAGGFQYDYDLDGQRVQRSFDVQMDTLTALHARVHDLDLVMEANGMTMELLKERMDLLAQLAMTMANGVSERVNMLLHIALDQVPRRPIAE